MFNLCYCSTMLSIVCDFKAVPKIKTAQISLRENGGSV